MNRQKFFYQFKGVFSKEDILKISWAYWIAKEAHRNQKRDEGDRYFEHSRRVSCLTFASTRPKKDEAPSANEIITALLHDCVEDCFPPQNFLRTLFGEEVALGVDTLSKINPVFDEATGTIIEKKKKNLQEYYAKIANSDMWIRRIKLCDRFDNLSGMDVWPEARKEKYRKETGEYILPIANEINWDLYTKLKGLLNS